MQGADRPAMQRRQLSAGGAMLALAALALGGCLTPRQEAQLDVFPRNRTFTAEQVVPLGVERTAFLGEYDNGGGQSICILQLAPDAVLTKRYHTGSDLTLFVVSGRGIVQVEQTRYRVEPGSAVLLPRLTAYAVLPHGSDEEFVALLVYSPPFAGYDVVVEE